jgi:hypothetical protein
MLVTIAGWIAFLLLTPIAIGAGALAREEREGPPLAFDASDWGVWLSGAFASGFVDLGTYQSDPVRPRRLSLVTLALATLSAVLVFRSIWLAVAVCCAGGFLVAYAGPFVGARVWNVFKPQITGDLEQAFFTAIWNGRLRIVKAAVKKGADVNWFDSRSDGCPTALILALKGGRDEIAGYLVSKGAQVNKTDNNGNTSLFFLTTCKNKAAMARLLIESGVDVNHRNDFGTTALRFCPSEAVIVLVEAGAQ